MDDLLTVAKVEDIEHAVQNGRNVSPAVGALRSVTLPAILEYGCLKWKLPRGSLPELPTTILDSPLGRALRQVRSELGLRSTGPAKQPLKRVDLQPVEFWVVEGGDGFADRSWEVFEICFNRSARSVGFAAAVADGLQGAAGAGAAGRHQVRGRRGRPAVGRGPGPDRFGRGAA